ncbi:hypothetical protein CRG98_018768 [Punica granatum]|uniref:Uncharacterized protein n=1 Tax=Punica granatum TaxID=22663 RepID=A0A2I0JWZ7_PUNGR|nr:hypothetical protein CRG98_018768 [Punica granatum]
MWGSGKLSLGLALLRVIAYLQEFYIYQLDDLLLNAEKEVGSLTPFKTHPDPEGAWFFCSAYVDLFGWLD